MAKHLMSVSGKKLDFVCKRSISVLQTLAKFGYLIYDCPVVRKPTVHNPEAFYQVILRRNSGQTVFFAFQNGFEADPEHKEIIGGSFPNCNIAILPQLLQILRLLNKSQEKYERSIGAWDPSIFSQ